MNASHRDLPQSRPRFSEVTGRISDTERRLVLVPRTHSLRAATEECIASVYERAFGSGQLTLSDALVALLDDDDRPICAAGLRTAAQGFFSEVYLDAPIERVLTDLAGQTVERERIFEVTSLASRSAEASPLFLRKIALLGKHAGFAWSFFTATDRLRQLLRRLGMPIIQLTTADPMRLPDAARWGSYYAHSPRVCAVAGSWIAPLGTPLAEDASHA